VDVKVLDIDRDRQRISLGLKQTQTDPWQQVLESYQEGDVVQGTVTKVVTFGAFVEILPGVEGLVHISELAQHHVENPREIVSQGDKVNVRILEVDADRRRLSLSLKRVEEGMPVQPMPGEEAAPPALGLSDEVFADEVPAAEALDAPVEEEPAAEAEAEVVAEVVEEEPAAEAEAQVVEAEESAPEVEAEVVEAEEPAAAELEPVAEEEPVVEVEPEAEPVAEAEPAVEAEPEAEADADASDEAPAE
jgi:small subunit ribosomal protein S1